MANVYSIIPLFAIRLFDPIPTQTPDRFQCRLSSGAAFQVHRHQNFFAAVGEGVDFVKFLITFGTVSAYTGGDLQLGNISARDLIAPYGDAEPIALADQAMVIELDAQTGKQPL